MMVARRSAGRRAVGPGEAGDRRPRVRLGGLRGAQQKPTQSLEIGLVRPLQRGEGLADERAQQVGDLLLAQAAEVAGWGLPSPRLLREEVAENDIVGLAAFFHLAETQP